MASKEKLTELFSIIFSYDNVRDISYTELCNLVMKRINKKSISSAKRLVHQAFKHGLLTRTVDQKGKGIININKG